MKAQVPWLVVGVSSCEEHVGKVVICSGADAAKNQWREGVCVEMKWRMFLGPEQPFGPASRAVIYWATGEAGWRGSN